MARENHQWKPSNGADEDHDDQETDFSNGWWAAVGPDYDGRWSWEVSDHPSIDGNPVADGHASDETAAKAAALAAYASLQKEG